MDTDQFVHFGTGRFQTPHLAVWKSCQKENRYLRIGVTHSDAEAVVQTLVKSLKVSFEAEMLTSLVTSHSFGVASQETSHVVHIFKFNI